MPNKPAALERVRVVGRVEGECTLYVWNGVFVVAWEGPTTIAGVRSIDRAVQSLRGSHAPVSAVHFMQGQPILPSAELREEFNRIAKAHYGAIACTAILDDRAGFVASAIKAVITGVSLITGARREMRLFSELSPLVDWVAATHREHTGVALDLGALREALTTVQKARGQSIT
jgi:hypothetical protein